MPTQTDEAPPISSLSDDELRDLAKSTPPLENLSDEDLLGVAVNQGLMQPDHAQQIITQRKAAARAPVADAIADSAAMNPMIFAPKFLTKALLTQGGRTGDIAAQVAGPILGGAAGAEGGPAGVAAGGAGGAAAGDSFAQMRQYLRGERDDFSKGEVIGSAVAGAIPLGNTVLTKPLVAVGKRVLQGAGVAGVADVTQQVVDQKPFDWSQLAQSLLTGGVLGGVGGAAEVGIPKIGNVMARKKVLDEIRKTPDFAGFTGTDAELTEAVRAKMQADAPVRSTEPINVTGTADEAPLAEQGAPATEAEARDAAMRSKAPAPQPLTETPAKASAAAEPARPLSDFSDDELRSLAKETAHQVEPEPVTHEARASETMPPHQVEVAANAVSKGLLEQPPARGPVSVALQQKYPELTHIPENQTPIEIKRADGSVYPATISGYADDAGEFPWIGRLTDHGWTHGHMKPGESIATPVPNPQQWSAGMREMPAEAPAATPATTDGLAPLPEGTQVQYLGRKHLVMEGVGEPTDQWQVKMPGEVGPGRTVTSEHLSAEGFQAPEPGQTVKQSWTVGQGSGATDTPATVETHAMGGSISRNPRVPVPTAPRAGAPANGRPGVTQPAPAAPTPPPPNELVKDLQRIQRLVAPQTIDASARFSANLLRELDAKMANELIRADHSLRQYRNSFDLTPVPKNWKYEEGKPLPRNYAFIDAYEGGRVSGLSPKEQEAAAEFRKQNAALIERVHALGTGALKTFYENYFPHIWNDPDKAKQVVAGILARRSLEGGKSFLQQRTHQLTVDGLAAGLTPVHDNPVDLWLLKKREVERYILGQTFVKEMKEAKLLKFVHAFSQKPEGYSTVNDRAFTVYGPPTVTIQEAFDAGMREKTLQALDALGVPHERVAKLRGKQWGYEQNLKDTPGSERIVTKFGGPDSVIWHELGHALDSRYPELRDAMIATPKMESELRALADLRAEGEKVSDSYQKYLRTTPEKMATILQAYLHAPEKMEAVAPTVKKAFEEFLQSKPELSVIDQIRPTLRLGTGEMELPVGGQVKLGNWYMPDSAAQVMNNFLSPGLNTHLWYRSLREVSNFMNSAQLSLSAFHLGFTSIDAMLSNMALAMEDAYHKEFASALKTAASTPLAPITNFIKGSQLRNAVLKAGDVSDTQLRQLVNYLEKGGGRAGQDPFFDGQMSRKMTRAFAAARDQIKTGDFLGGTTDATKSLAFGILGALEKTTMPIHAIVVRQKLGVIANMAERDIRRNAGASPEQIRALAQKSVDSASNRMGQMEYNNMMMNRVVKDTLLLSVRSAGWQIGKVREGGGAVLDAADFVRGKAAPSRRMFYVASLVAGVGMMGALINYLYTGEAPKSWRDYFLPRTGEIDENGNPVRINLPTYLKDVFAFYRHPVTGATHALAPYISAASDLLANKDYYGYQIRNPNDPLWQQGSDVAKWAMSEIRPFSVSGALQLHKNDSPVLKTILPFFGFTPVSQSETMTPAQELSREIMSANMPSRPMDRNKYDQNKYLKDIIQQVKLGHPEQGKKLLAEGLDKGILDVNTSRLLMEHLKYTPLQFQVHHFAPDVAMRVFRIASPAEQEQLRGIIAVKVLDSKTLSPAVKATYLSELKSNIPARRAAAAGSSKP